MADGTNSSKIRITSDGGKNKRTESINSYLFFENGTISKSPEVARTQPHNLMKIKS